MANTFTSLHYHIVFSTMHHRVKTFQEEYLAFLVRHGIEYDERYLWD